MIRLYAFYGFNDLTEEEYKEVCNGAGALGDWRSNFIPNTLYGLDCTVAFDIHDHAYHVGKTIVDKRVADRQMLTNLMALIEPSGWFMAFFRRRRALKYYEAVKLGGAEPFWSGKERLLVNQDEVMGYQDGRRFDMIDHE